MTSSSSETIVRLQLIQYWVNWLTAGFATGKWNSLFLGRGYDFQGIAPFRDDPDMVRLNWQATLIEGELQVSQFSEERNINVYFLADMSPSMAFGSHVTKLERLALLAAVVAFSAFRLKDNFRYVGYTDQVELGFPTIIRDKIYPLLLAKTILGFNWHGKRGGGLPVSALRIPSQKSLVIIVSDFLGNLEEIERTLTILAPKHEVLPLILTDEREVALPGKGWGLYPLQDLETGETGYVFLTPVTRKKFAQNSRLRREELETVFGRFGIQPHFLIGENAENDIEALMKLFLIRRSRL